MSKRLGEIIGCKDKTSSGHLIEFPDGSNIGSTVSCQGETHVMLYIYISKTKAKDAMSLDYISI